MSQNADRNLTCRDCGKTFTFTAGEQEFYASRGFSEPLRCGQCRAERKVGRDSGGYSASSYTGTRSYGSTSSYSSGSGYGAGSSYGSGAPRQMHKTVCAECGAETEVPFEPRQGRPVYCRSCFQQHSPRR